MRKVGRLKCIIALVLAFVCAFFAVGDNMESKYKIDTFIVDESVAGEPFLGFGTSSCWWSQWVTDSEIRTEIAQALYSTDGLNLHVYRYNVGGGERDNPNNTIYNHSRTTESFLVWNNDLGDYEYDFTRDAAARAMLDAAIEQGAEEVVLFCNSPHFSMTTSGTAAGGVDGVSNLSADKYEAFADYLITIADWFVAEGYPVKYISPINEPQWQWSAGNHQEGCHYSPAEAVALYEVFVRKLTAKQSPYRLLGVENGSLSTDANDYIDAMFSSTLLREYMDVYCGHSYWMDGNLDEKAKNGEYLATTYPDKTLIMSEWCELPQRIDPRTIGSGLYMANIIEQDFNLLRVRGWENWTAVNGDGLLDIVDGSLVYYNRYFAYMSFTRFIDVGARKVSTRWDGAYGSDIRAVSFSQEGRLVIVFVNNTNDEYSPRIDTTMHYKHTAVYLTDSTHNCERTAARSHSRISLPARSIVTVVLSN